MPDRLRGPAEADLGGSGGILARRGPVQVTGAGFCTFSIGMVGNGDSEKPAGQNRDRRAFLSTSSAGYAVGVRRYEPTFFPLYVQNVHPLLEHPAAARAAADRLSYCFPLYWT